MGSFNSKIEKPDVTMTKDGLRAMQGWIQSKLKTFYLEVEQQLLIGGNKAIDIPIVSIIDKDSSTFVKEATHTENNISDGIQSAVGNLISGEWKPAITDVLKGGLNVFLGDRRVGSGGKMQEHKSFHLVWSDTALLRIDMYALRFDVTTDTDTETVEQFFGGHMLIKSIVDIDKISPQILSYEIVKFLDSAAKVKDKDGNLVPSQVKPKERLIKQINDCKEVFGGVSSLLGMMTEYQRKSASDESFDADDEEDEHDDEPAPKRQKTNDLS